MTGPCRYPLAHIRPAHWRFCSSRFMRWHRSCRLLPVTTQARAAFSFAPQAANYLTRRARQRQNLPPCSAKTCPMKPPPKPIARSAHWRKPIMRRQARNPCCLCRHASALTSAGRRKILAIKPPSAAPTRAGPRSTFKDRPRLGISQGQSGASAPPLKM